jgi:hypothetical protein
MAQSDRSRGIQPATPDAPTPPAGEARTAKSDAEERHRRISQAAYYRSQQRGFTAGQEQDDWLQAEQDVDRGTPTDKKPEENDFPSPK